MAKRILIAEDDPDILFILEIVLSEAGYAVELMAEGSSILQRKKQLPDLFILDKEMPLVDGLTISKHLKSQEETKHIPIIMISAYHKAHKKAKAVGVEAFIDKPFEIHDLLKTVSKYISNESRATIL
jgi:CheY-like chemotaxis protein